jgi:tetratricopeptide (TPR) repeat protein
MKLPSFLTTFSEQQKKTLIKVAKISVALCIVAVVGVWVTQKVLTMMHAPKSTDQGSFVDLKTLYSGKNQDLLPVDIEAHRFVARYYLRTNQSKDAIPHLLRVLSVEPSDRIARKELGEAYLESAIYEDALTLLEDLSADKIQDSLSGPILALYGLALFHDGETRHNNAQVQRSISTLDAALQAYPKCAEAACFRGEVEAAIDSTASLAPEAYFKRALESDPNYGEALYQWARFLMNRTKQPSKEDLVSAREKLLKILEIEPLNPKVHSRLGMLYYYLGQPDLARNAYRTAMTLNPGDYNTHYNLGELDYSVFGDRSEALKEFKETLKYDSAHVDACFRIGLISLENEMINEAVSYLQRARQLQPNNIRILLQLGVALEKKGMQSEALGVYNQVLDLDPVNEVARQKAKLLKTNPQ